MIEAESLLASARVVQVAGAATIAPPAETQQMGDYDDQWSGLVAEPNLTTGY